MLVLTQTLVVALLLGASELGYRAGAKSDDDERVRSQASTMQGALLGLLALLLGFTASMAEARFSHRRELILMEANAIGTAYLRGDLLGPERRDVFRARIRDYVDERIAFYEAGTDVPAEVRALERTAELQAELWTLATADVTSHPDIAVSVIESVNALIDAEGMRRAALRAHVPFSLFFLLVCVALVAVGACAHTWGQTRRRSVLGVTVLPLLVALAIGVVLDLDSPREGLVRAGEVPMELLHDAIAEH